VKNKEAGVYRYTPASGDPVRVVIVGDVIALLGGFGKSISAEWLLTQPHTKIPGTKRRRLELVACIQAALDDHYDVPVSR
jgi:hypothetical protein